MVRKGADVSVDYLDYLGLENQFTLPGKPYYSKDQEALIVLIGFGDTFLFLYSSNVDRKLWLKMQTFDVATLTLQLKPTSVCIESIFQGKKWHQGLVSIRLPASLYRLAMGGDSLNNFVFLTKHL